MPEYNFTTETIAQAMRTLPPMCFVKRATPEWDAMWETLGRMPLNRQHSRPTVCQHEHGEAWQYMGSFAHDGAWVHEFRHRWHPTTGKREYARIPATIGWGPRSE